MGPFKENTHTSSISKLESSLARIFIVMKVIIHILEISFYQNQNSN